MSTDARDYEWTMGFVGAVIDDIRASRTPGAAGSTTNAMGYMTDSTTFASGVIARLNRCQNHLDEAEGHTAEFRGDL